MPWTGADDFLRRARARLVDAAEAPGEPNRTDFDLNPGLRFPASPPYTPAAVLIGLVGRGDDFGVVLTLRPETMARHAGQVAFPGGRVDPQDASPLAAALREAREEVGINPDTADVLGRADPYLTSTGYVVAPYVALLPGDFEPVPEPHEVAAVFETPLSFLMDPVNHERHERSYNGVLRAYYAMPHNGRYIWGATAGIIKSLYDRLYGEGAAMLPSSAGGQTQRGP